MENHQMQLPFRFWHCKIPSYANPRTHRKGKQCICVLSNFRYTPLMNLKASNSLPFSPQYFLVLVNLHNKGISPGMINCQSFESSHPPWSILLTGEAASKDSSKSTCTHSVEFVQFSLRILCLIQKKEARPLWYRGEMMICAQGAWGSSFF